MTARAEPRPAPAAKTGRAAEALEHAPPLAWLAALAAVVDLGWNRIAIVALGGSDDALALWLLRTGPFWRNLAAVAGLIALGSALFTYFRMAGFAAPLRRMQVAALSGLLLPALVLAAVVAKESLPWVVVLLTVGVGNALVVVFGVTAGGYFKSPYRAGVWGGALGSILVLLLLVVTNLESLQIWLSDDSTFAGKIAWGLLVGCRVGGELLWLSTPLVVARWALSELRSGSSRALAVAVTTAIIGVAAFGETSRHTDFSVVAYGAFRVTVLSEELVGLYALPVGVVLGVGVALIATGTPLARQLGTYLLLATAAGFAPRTPIQVLYLVLAMVVIARAVQASDPEGRRRASLAWGEPLEPLTVPVPARALAEVDEVDDGGGDSDAGARTAAATEPVAEAGPAPSEDEPPGAPGDDPPTEARAPRAPAPEAPVEVPAEPDALPPIAPPS